MEGRETLEFLPGSERQIVWVPERRSIKHALFNVPEQLSGRKRSSALDLKVDAWAPFSETAYSALWNGNEASVFAWDKRAVEEKIIVNGYNPRHCKVVPEVFIREPVIEGVRLVKVSDGVEGQAWKDGFLRATRWWKEYPNSQEWGLFLRNAGDSISVSIGDPPTPSNPLWLEKPLNGATGKEQILFQILNNHKFVKSAATLSLVPIVFFGIGWLTSALMLSGVEQEIERIQVDSQSVREERSRALALLDYIEQLSSLRQFPHQIEIISRAHSLLAEYDVEISGWDYDEGILEFGLISDSDMDATLYIPIFENDEFFDQVSSSTRGTRLIMKMDVLSNEGVVR